MTDYRRPSAMFSLRPDSSPSSQDKDPGGCLPLPRALVMPVATPPSPTKGRKSPQVMSKLTAGRDEQEYREREQDGLHLRRYLGDRGNGDSSTSTSSPSTPSRLSPPRRPRPPPLLPSPGQRRWLEEQGRRHYVNAMAKEEQKRREAGTVHERKCGLVPNLGVFLHGSSAKMGVRDGAVLDARNGEKVAHFSKKRLTKSNHCDIGSIDGADATTTLSSVLKRPLGAMDVAHLAHSEIEIGDIIGAGSYSAIFEIRSISLPKTRQPDSLVYPKFDHEQVVESRRQDMRRASKAAATCPYVLKVLQPKLLENPAQMASCAADLAKEGLLLATLRHDHILRPRAWTPHGLRGYASGRHDSFFLVLDRLDRGTLADRIGLWQNQCAKSSRRPLKMLPSKMQHLSPSTSIVLAQLEVILQLADALQYLHSQRVIHRDIKPDNVGLVSVKSVPTGTSVSQAASLSVKLFDFDVARRLPPASAGLTINGVPGMFLLTHHVGSPRFMSPECARGDPYNASTDVYSFGLVAHHVLSLQPPYADVDTADFARRVIHGGLRPPVPKSWAPLWQALLPSCWLERPEQRPAMEDVFQLLKETVPKLQEQLLLQDEQRRTRPRLPSTGSFSSKNSVSSRNSLKRTKSGPPGAIDTVDVSGSSVQRSVSDAISSSSTQSNSIGEASSTNSDEEEGRSRHGPRRRRRKPWSKVLKGI